MKTIISAQTKVASMDDIIFENRNLNYGSYELRKHYNRYLLLSFLITAGIIISAIVITNFYMNHTAAKKNLGHDVIIDMDPSPAIERPIVIPPPPVINSLTKLASFQVPNVVENTENPGDDKIDLEDPGPVIATGTFIDTMRYITDDQIPKTEGDEPPCIYVSETATFQGEDLNSFGRWVMDNLKYTDEMNSMQLEGKLMIRFVVNKNGNVEDIKVLRGVDPLIDNEAVRVIKKSPAWKAGKLNGKKVRQMFVMPIVFRLQ